MAKLVAFQQFNLLDVDLNFYFEYTYDSSLTKNGQFQFGGVTYPDAFYVNGYDGYDDLELYLLRSDLAQDATGRITSGVVNFIAEAEFEGDILWYAEGLSVSAPAIYNAAETPSNSDELGLIVTAFSGDDTIILSPFADRMSGISQAMTSSPAGSARTGSKADLEMTPSSTPGQG